jgi:xylulokinase
LALDRALAEAGGVDNVAALAVGGQQHGMVCLDEADDVVRPALLCNDMHSAPAAAESIEELGGGEAGRRAWVDAVGSGPMASFTVTKLRWLAETEPANAARTAAVCLPHDWLTWRLAGAAGLDTLVTHHQGDASGTGYWSAATGEYRRDLLVRALGSDAVLPRVLGPAEKGGATPAGALLGSGAGDNAAAALGLGAKTGDVVVSIGTSGVACAASYVPAADVSGTVAGFADATAGRFLPLVCTLNATRVLDAIAGLLEVDHEEFSRLALSAGPEADGLVLVPYFEGERTPDRPDATGALHGIRLANCTAANVARASGGGPALRDALTASTRSRGRVRASGGSCPSVVARVWRRCEPVLTLQAGSHR